MLQSLFTGSAGDGQIALYVAGKGMTIKAKVRIVITATLLMSIGFIMMGLKEPDFFCHRIVRMILDLFPIILILHRCISIAPRFFLAIHIFGFHKKPLSTGQSLKRDVPKNFIVVTSPL